LLRERALDSHLPYYTELMQRIGEYRESVFGRARITEHMAVIDLMQSKLSILGVARNAEIDEVRGQLRRVPRSAPRLARLATAELLTYGFAVAPLRGNTEVQMETNELYRGRLIDHLQLVVRNLDVSERFYAAVLGALGIRIGGRGPGFFWADELVVSSRESPASAGELTGRVHLAFQAKDRAMVDTVFEAALAAGGKDNGKPGERPYHPGYYAGFVLDPDGNNVEVVYHGPATRSAESIRITF
jgi:lactoylglutathione lyase